jgi:hypothetical protein
MSTRYTDSKLQGPRPVNVADKGTVVRVNDMGGGGSRVVFITRGWSVFLHGYVCVVLVVGIGGIHIHHVYYVYVKSQTLDIYIIALSCVSSL